MAETTMHFEYPPGASPAEIWAILREVAEGQKETRLQMQETDKILKEVGEHLKETSERQKETDRQIKETSERQKETDRQIKETSERQKETDRQIKETAKQMKKTDEKFGKLSNRFGELAEHLVVPNIKEKFNALGFTFVRASQNIEITDLAGNCLAEVDILLENGSIVMVLEIKSKPSYDDVADHIKRMEIMRRDADARNDKRMLQGAVAGAIMTSEVRKHIQKNGFYAIEQTGDTVKINTPEGFKARQW